MLLKARNLSNEMKKYAPGLLTAFTIAAASRFISEHYGAPAMLFALLIGMAFNFVYENEKCKPGIELCSKQLLKIGVALLGVRVTFEQISSLGWGPVLLVVSLIFLTILAAITLSKLFSRSVNFGILTGGAVAICGASAALALSAVLSKSEEMTRDTLFTVVAVTSLSTIAMIIYPILFQLFGFDDATIGILIGATIHDVAQVVGAGFAVSDEAGEIATYVKLLRVSCLPIVIVGVALMMRNNKTSGAVSSFPWFAVGFVLILVLNSVGFIPQLMVSALNSTSQWLLIAAIAALGVKTSLKEMVSLGPVYFGLVVAETLILFGLAVLAIFLI